MFVRFLDGFALSSARLLWVECAPSVPRVHRLRRFRGRPGQHRMTDAGVGDLQSRRVRAETCPEFSGLRGASDASESRPTDRLAPPDSVPRAPALSESFRNQRAGSCQHLPDMPRHFDLAPGPAEDAVAVDEEGRTVDAHVLAALNFAPCSLSVPRLFATA